MCGEPLFCMFVSLCERVLYSTEQEEITNRAVPSTAKMHSKRQYVLQKRLQTAVLQFRADSSRKLCQQSRK